MGAAHRRIARVLAVAAACWGADCFSGRPIFSRSLLAQRLAERNLAHDAVSQVGQTLRRCFSDARGYHGAGGQAGEHDGMGTGSDGFVQEAAGIEYYKC